MGKKTKPVVFIKKRGEQNRNKRRGKRGRTKSQRGKIQRKGNDQKQSCYKCRNPFGPGHFQKFPAKDKICKKCTKRGHYARLCNSSNVNANTEEQDPDQPIQDTDKAACVNYLQVGDKIPGWELIHPEVRSVNVVNFHE